MNKKEKKRKEGTGEREEGRKGRKEERGREGEIGCDMTSLLVQENIFWRPKHSSSSSVHCIWNSGFTLQFSDS